MAQPEQRPAVGVVRFYNFLSEDVSFLGEVLAGLARPQKTLPASYLYDAHGRALYEHICRVPERGDARAELAIMREHGAAMAEFVGSDCQLIGFGGGADETMRDLIERLRPQLYVPIDSAMQDMQSAAAGLAQRLPWLNISGVCAERNAALALPQFVGVPIQKKVVYINASAIGSAAALPVLESLQLARRMVGAGGALLAAVALKRDAQALVAAYNDAEGATAAFNLNLLARINRELGADFQLRRFGHLAFYVEERGCIELHLQSLATQLAHVGAKRFNFAQGETMLTGLACRYGPEEFRELAQRAGFAPVQTWTDAENLFTVHAMRAA